MGKRKYYIESLQDYARTKSGKCLSLEYADPLQKYEWQCSKGHTWQALWANVKRGSWCPRCSGRTRGSMEYMQELAAKHGGRCLSDQYVNAETHLEWECAEGHRWPAKPNNIQQGKWCRICRRAEANRKQLRPISVLRRYAESRGGRFLTENYSTPTEELEWECAEGHRWKSSARSLYGPKSWCKTCAYERLRRMKLDPEGLEKLRNTALERGGELLSRKYMGVGRKHLWKCTHGHEWEATPNHIVHRGNWCRVCSGGIGERITRAFFDQIFEKPFIRVRPEWLVTENGGRLELDGYCEDLQLAFEHQGPQHKRVVTRFGGTEASLRAQIARDAQKREICSARGITLIEIPEVPGEVLVPALRDFILQRCKEQGIHLPADADGKPVDLRAAYSFGPLQRLRAKAAERGGELVSEHFNGYNRKHTWRCKAGHTWEAVASSVIFQGTWCKHCGHRTAKYTMQEIITLAESRGGNCLSTEYTGSHGHLKWLCAQGHEWPASLTSIVQGNWCPTCAGQKRLTIEEMRKIARARGGECLSSEYVNSKTHLKWRCSEGHEWLASPNNVKNKESWCDICAYKYLRFRNARA